MPGSGDDGIAVGVVRPLISVELQASEGVGGQLFLSEIAEAALSRQGRYQEVADNLRVKQVRIAEDERFVICHSPEGAERDAAIRARMIAQLKELIDGTDTLSKDKRAELRGVISTKPGLNRYLRVTPGGLLRVDASKAKADENLDGKYLLRTSDPKLSAEDIALGYKQLLEVERGWRDMKQVIDLRPVYHRKEERIRSHVILRWLALLLARVAENACDATWPELRRQLDRIQVGTFTGPAGTFRQRTEISPAQRDILGRLGITPPPKITSSPPPQLADQRRQPPRYTASIQKAAHSRTSNPRFADQHATQLRNPGLIPPWIDPRRL